MFKLLKISTVIILIIYLFFLSSNLKAQDDETPPNSKHPLLKLSEANVNFDTIIHNRRTTKQLTIKNEGNAPLNIYNVRSSCGVSVPEYPRDPLKPNQEGTIRVRYNATQLGPIDRKVIIHSNSPENSLIINLIGYVVPLSH